MLKVGDEFIDIDACSMGGAVNDSSLEVGKTYVLIESGIGRLAVSVIN